jgi:hypothetical protein
MVSKTRTFSSFDHRPFIWDLTFVLCSRQSDKTNERLPPSYQNYVDNSYEHVANGIPYPHTQMPMATDYVAPSARRYTPEEFQRRIRQTMYDQQ